MSGLFDHLMRRMQGTEGGIQMRVPGPFQADAGEMTQLDVPDPIWPETRRDAAPVTTADAPRGQEPPRSAAEAAPPREPASPDGPAEPPAMQSVPDTAAPPEQGTVPAATRTPPPEHGPREDRAHPPPDPRVQRVETHHRDHTSSLREEVIQRVEERVLRETTERTERLARGAAGRAADRPSCSTRRGKAIRGRGHTAGSRSPRPPGQAATATSARPETGSSRATGTARTRAAAQAPALHVEIGRVEIHAAAARPSAPRTASPKPAPVMSLDAYLKGKGGAS